MSSTVIQVDHLWKKYRLGVLGTGTLRHDFNRWLHRVAGKPDPYARVGEGPTKIEDRRSKIESRSPNSDLPSSTSSATALSPISDLPSPSSSLRDDEMWALRDVSFEVKQGEILGIIGRNGAGKSTLLKILSRVTAPTTGEVRVKGRIASLLEVGTGFHPELTGRENIFLNGAILGMTKAEIKGKLDEIVAFAEVEKFLDTPVKRYSSGMYVRLAFAVAAHLEPEILIVDEVLAVGDAQFQNKCLGKMQDVSRGGRTVLFVSHNMTAVQNLCVKSVWIDKGTMRQIGPTSEIVHAYLNRARGPHASSEMDLRQWSNRYGNGEARILSARLLDEKGNPTSIVWRTRPMAVEFVVESRCRHPLHLSAAVVADSGVRVLHLSHHDTIGFTPGVIQGRCVIRFKVTSTPLCAGDYSFVLAIHSENLIPIDVATQVLPFTAEDIANSPRPYRTISEYAYCWTPNSWSIAADAEDQRT